MSIKINYVVKTPSVKDGLFTVFKVTESEGKIESKEVFFSGCRERVIKVLSGLIDDQLKLQGSISGQFIHIKSEVLQEIPECFDQKTGRQEFIHFGGIDRKQFEEDYGQFEC